MTAERPDRARVSTATDYFESMYRSDPDPWRFDRSWYEQRKYEMTVASLPRRRYRRAIEPGCANGALTERLASRCDELFAYDIVSAAVKRTEDRLAQADHVHVLEAVFPTYLPVGTGDLAVWSEVAYYLGDIDADRAIASLERWLEPDGHLVAVHYTGDTNYPRTAREVHDQLDSISWLSRVTVLDDEQFTLGVWTRTRSGRAGRSHI